LLRQLVEKYDGIPDKIRTFYTEHIALGARPSLADYSQLLQLAATRFSKIFLIIDALDESNEDIRGGLLREVRKLPPSSHLLCTSRHIPDIEQQLYDFAYQEVRASNKDVENYIVGSIEQNMRLRNLTTADPSLREVIITSIIAKVDGML
jgi:hypothetical protein